MAFSGTPFLRETRFTQFFIRENGLDQEGFEEWIFCPGMLFNAMDKWWGDRGKRDKPHEGLDLCLYRDRQDRILHLAEKTKIPVWYDGVVVSMVDDFLGKSVIVEHGHPHNDHRRWCTLYGHTKPRRGLHVGSTVKQGDIIATLAPSSRAKRFIPPHLHLSLGWISKVASYDKLDWKTIGALNTLKLLDPLEVIRWPYLVMEAEVFVTRVTGDFWT